MHLDLNTRINVKLLIIKKRKTERKVNRHTLYIKCLMCILKLKLVSNSVTEIHVSETFPLQYVKLMWALVIENLSL